ncbi:MAG: hypothetical protein CL685_04035 [Candidatus Magasanikbacteria bacterium]|nr:hypothetical protein [Candidatus Magasanikbacteria bacterium]|tara:strand:- start:864 stop:1568 length:705 start_codon:yes stop_codon:yes gene_type:complete
MFLNIVFHRIVNKHSDLRDTYELTTSQFVQTLSLVRRLSRQNVSPFTNYRLYFDDGDNSFLSIVLPLLKKRELKNVVLAITTDNVGQPGFLSYDDLSWVQEKGVVISSHSVSHPALAYYINGVAQESAIGAEYQTAPFGHTRRLTAQEILFQLKESKKTLQDNGFFTDEFVLPHGCYNDTVLRINKKNNLYDTISTCDEFIDSGTYLRPRVLTRHDVPLEYFERKITLLTPYTV